MARYSKRSHGPGEEICRLGRAGGKFEKSEFAKFLVFFSMRNKRGVVGLLRSSLRQACTQTEKKEHAISGRREGKPFWARLWLAGVDGMHCCRNNLERGSLDIPPPPPSVAAAAKEGMEQTEEEEEEESFMHSFHIAEWTTQKKKERESSQFLL